jgi:ubiquinone biosynthesis protein
VFELKDDNTPNSSESNLNIFSIRHLGLVMSSTLKRNLGRIRQVINVASKHGFLRIIKRIGLKNLVTMKPTKFESVGDEPVRVRKMLEELGPTYVKIGQTLSMRPDLIPPEYVKELSQLYDEAAPIPFDEIKKRVESELGKTLDEVFKSFDEKSIASASMGQVHKAELLDGTKVVVKVQRPGIREIIDTDIDIVYFFANLAEKNIPSMKTFRPVEVVRELEEMLHNEINYLLEAKNAERIYMNFQKVPWVKIPKIFPELCTKRILTMELIEGHRLTKRGLKVKGIENKKIATLIARAMVKQLFQDGFFQADPSPGNIFVIDNKSIAFVDFGAMGKISQSRRKQLMEMLVGVATNDVDSVLSSLLEMSDIEGEIDKEALKRDITGLLEYYHEEKPTVYDIEIADGIIELSRKYDIRLPADFTLLERALFETESTCRLLDPDFDLLKASAPIIREVTMERIGPKEQIQEFIRNLKKYEKLFKYLPTRIDKILNKLEAGELTVKMDVRGVTHMETKIGEVFRSLEIGLIVFALIIALTVIYISEKSMGTSNYLFFLFLIFIGWILVNFFRSIKIKGRS